MESKKDIGKLKEVPLREIWKNEAKDFTDWLSNNLDVLEEGTDQKLSLIKKEKEVGPFALDILAENQNGEKVIIENQLEKTDHTHLGQLLTYAINLGSPIAIWITHKPKSEHVKVIDWLNENTERSFYLLQIKAVKIGTSSPAAQFTVISKPNDVTKKVGQEKKELAETEHQRIAFWKSLLDKMNKKSSLFGAISPSINHWISAGAGKSGITYNFVITNNYVGTELYIDYDKGKGTGNKKIFDKLYQNKKKIESIINRKLKWERKDKKRSSAIECHIEGYGLKDQDKWDEMQEKITDIMVKFDKAFTSLIKSL